MDSTTTQKSWVSSTIHCQPKNKLSSLEKKGKMHKNVREAPSLLTGAKTASSKHKIMAPFFPFTPTTPKMHSGCGEGKEIAAKPWRRQLPLFLLREGAKTPWWWVRNEIHGCIMAWAGLPKILHTPQVKKTLSKNVWPPKFEFDPMPFPSQGDNFFNHF